MKYKPSFIDKIEVGTTVYPYGYGDNYTCDVKEIDGTKFHIYTSKKTNTKFALGYYSKRLIAKECNTFPKNLEKTLIELVKKHRNRKCFTCFKDWADFMPTDIFKKLQEYTGCSYGSIKKSEKEGKLDWFVKGLYKMPKSKCKVIYRGMCFQPINKKKFLKDIKVGKVFEIDSTTSFSSDKGIADSFAGSYNSVFMKVYAKNAKKVEFNTSEKECLLLKGTKLLVKEMKHKGKRTEMVLEEYCEEDKPKKKIVKKTKKVVKKKNLAAKKKQKK